MTDATRGPRERPLSPHLQIWRWHITMACSILHRASIFGLYFGALLLSGWLLALAAGPEIYDAYMTLLTCQLGLVVLIGVTFMVFYNMAYNVRQAFWDLGHGFELATANATGLGAIAFGAAATVALWGGLFVLGVL
jgi:succinate dehydrogenase / fumarate reductase cytochrome b subunit